MENNFDNKKGGPQAGGEGVVGGGAASGGEWARCLDIRSLLERVDGDKDLLRELLELSIEDFPRVFAEVRTAAERRDAARLERAAHTLKGAVSNFGAEGVRAAAASVENSARTGDLAGLEAQMAVLEVEINRLMGELEVLTREAA